MRASATPRPPPELLPSRQPPVCLARALVGGTGAYERYSNCRDTDCHGVGRQLLADEGMKLIAVEGAARDQRRGDALDPAPRGGVRKGGTCLVEGLSDEE